MPNLPPLQTLIVLLTNITTVKAFYHTTMGKPSATNIASTNIESVPKLNLQMGAYERG
jgi:hypothetical protein